MMLQTKSFITIIFFLFFNFSITSILYSKFSILTMAENQPSSSALYIVHTEQPTEGVDHEAFHLQTLSSVLGSEEAAKESLIYVYKSAATGFSAKLTPEQVSELEKIQTQNALNMVNVGLSKQDAVVFLSVQVYKLAIYYFLLIYSLLSRDGSSSSRPSRP
ncbi:subtilisin-like protease SBT5.6 isoform X1 [Amaranthus tricolor]|uniref:subtilisin-like protease SBT5.6 isoform X1 n=1 Tax=Amaranthus tricolor TaxID=29722 RepID=UPI00258556DE|nr:subtilisin-like protease SBT5.6 isoform X1 [Amaranthus tricolor]